jgi:hypothetical protein
MAQLELTVTAVKDVGRITRLEKVLGANRTWRIEFCGNALVLAAYRDCKTRATVIAVIEIGSIAFADTADAAFVAVIDA